MFRLILCLMFSSSLSYAHHMQGVQREDPSYKAMGQLITFVAVPKEKTLRIYLAGRETAKMAMDSEPRLLSVHLLKKDKKTELKFQRNGSGYDLIGVPERGKFDLDLDAQILDKSDSVRMSIDIP